MSEGDSHQIIATLNHLVGKVEGIDEKIDVQKEELRRSMELHENRDDTRFRELFTEVGTLKVEVARAKGIAAVIGGGVGIAVALLKDVLFKK